MQNLNSEFNSDFKIHTFERSLSLFLEIIDFIDMIPRPYRIHPVELRFTRRFNLDIVKNFDLYELSLLYIAETTKQVLFLRSKFDFLM